VGEVESGFYYLVLMVVDQCTNRIPVMLNDSFDQFVVGHPAAGFLFLILTTMAVPVTLSTAGAFPMTMMVSVTFPAAILISFTCTGSNILPVVTNPVTIFVNKIGSSRICSPGLEIIAYAVVVLVNEFSLNGY
jgi:hypothetical protein